MFFVPGIVRAESFTKKPIIRPQPPIRTTPITAVECVMVAPTNQSATVESPRISDEEPLQQFVISHTAALGAIGGLLLVLNLVLCFGAFFYHRHRRRRSKRPCMPEEGDLAMPCYDKNITLPQVVPSQTRIPPTPPVRTSSNPPSGTLKKRVQIQEIPV